MNRLRNAWDDFAGTAHSIKEQLQGSVEDDVDRYLGVFMYHQIATLFIFDEEVQARVYGGYTCPRCGYVTRDKFDECHNCSQKFDGDEEWHSGIVELARDDEMDRAIEHGETLEGYIMMKAENDRVYQKHLKKVRAALGQHSEELQERFKNLSPDNFMDHIKEENPDGDGS